MYNIVEIKRICFLKNDWFIFWYVLIKFHMKFIFCQKIKIINSFTKYDNGFLKRIEGKKQRIY